MSALARCGFETQLARAEVSFSEGSPAISTAQARSGLASLAFTGSVHQNIDIEFTGVLGRVYYCRVWMRPSVAKPTNSLQIVNFSNTDFATAGFIYWETDGTLALYNFAGTRIGSKTAALEAEKWYCLELKVKVASSPTTSNGELAGRLDGVEFASSGATNVGTKALGYMYVCDTSGSIGGTIYVDDLGINDDQGENQNTWLGNIGKIVILFPAIDIARTPMWIAGAGGTTNLWDAVNNKPPAGLSVGSATNTSQIKNNTKSSEEYEAGLKKFEDTLASGGGGLTSKDVVLLLQVMARVAPETAASRSSGIQATVPTIAETTATLAPTAGATEPTGWSTIRTVYQYGTSLSELESFETRIKLRTINGGGSGGLMCDFMGLLVEYYDVEVVNLTMGKAAGVGNSSLSLLTSPVIAGKAEGKSTSTLSMSAPTSITMGKAAGVSNASLSVNSPVFFNLKAEGKSTSALSLWAHHELPTQRSMRWPFP